MGLRQEAKICHLSYTGLVCGARVGAVKLGAQAGRGGAKGGGLLGTFVR